jgi:hypothetical protein
VPQTHLKGHIYFCTLFFVGGAHPPKPLKFAKQVALFQEAYSFIFNFFLATGQPPLAGPAALRARNTQKSKDDAKSYNFRASASGEA